MKHKLHKIKKNIDIQHYRFWWTYGSTRCVVVNIYYIYGNYEPTKRNIEQTASFFPLFLYSFDWLFVIFFFAEPTIHFVTQFSLPILYQADMYQRYCIMLLYSQIRISPPRCSISEYNLHVMIIIMYVIFAEQL